MATRWSGDVRVRVAVLETGMCQPHRYDCRVDIPSSPYSRPVWRNEVSLAPYFSETLAADSAEAIDRIALAAISFSTYDREDLNGFVRYHINGTTKIARRKDCRWR
jgi:hypothetical protein